MALELDMKSFEGFEELSAEELYEVDGGYTAQQYAEAMAKGIGAGGSLAITGTLALNAANASLGAYMVLIVVASATGAGAFLATLNKYGS